MFFVVVTDKSAGLCLLGSVSAALVLSDGARV
jgi:hypothetical protein